jgi:hypothetical protein
VGFNGLHVYARSDPSVIVHEVTLSLSLNLSAVAACSATESTRFAWDLRQPNVTIHFFSSRVASDVLVAATAKAIQVLPDGLLAVRAGVVERWWSDYSTLFLDVSTIELLQGRAAELCGVHRASGLRDGSVYHIQQHSRALFVASMTPMKKTLEMNSLTDRPWMTHAAPGIICSAECDAGLAVKPLSVSGPAVRLPQLPSFEIFNASVYNPIGCLKYSMDDFANCNTDKRTADRRVARCLAAFDANLTRSRVLKAPEEMGVHLQSLGAHPRDIGTFLSHLDCNAFTRSKAAHCTCSADSTSRSAATLQALEQAVGQITGQLAPNRPHDISVVRERLWSLGYARTSFAIAPPADSCEANLPERVLTVSDSPSFIDNALQDHLTRVFLCAAAGATSFERVCDVARKK